MKIAFAGFRHDHILGLYEMAVKNEEVEIVGCYEEDAQARQAVEASHQVLFTYRTYKEILQDEQVEAVAIGDYYGKRGRMIIDALKHNKHVICDKPLCTNLDEWKQISDISMEKGLQVSCMLDLRYMPQVEQAKKVIQAGELGEIHAVSFTAQHCLNYGVRPQWYFEEGKHGGTINDIAIHGIDLIRYLTGKNITKINYAKTWNAFAKEEPQFKDCGQLMIEMDEMSVMADVSYAAPKCTEMLPTYWDFYFWGSEGMMNFRYKDNTLHIFKDKEYVTPCEKGDADCMSDFVKELNGISTVMNAKDMMESQRQVLLIQQYTDEREEQ